MTKYIFMTGGVVSGIGKGLNAASIGRILKDRGFRVFIQKFDPYLNVYPGLLSPIQHGEVFVTCDGAETDLDLGHYERFIDEKLSQDSAISAGKVYKSVFEKEARGDYDGKTVQIIPHVTDQIKSKVYKVAEDTKADIIITEIGGTVGDIEGLPFIEAIRQIGSEKPDEDVIFIHTTLVPAVPGSDELKTKPTQHSYKELMSYGIKPDIFVLRADHEISQEIKEKISLFCDIPVEAVIQSKNVDLIYEVPVSLRQQGIDEQILKSLNLSSKLDSFSDWENMVEKFKHLDHELDIAIVGHHIELEDSYLSTNNALLDAGYNLSTKVNLHFLHPSDINKGNVSSILGEMDGLVLPTGSMREDISGLLTVAKYARENKLASLGIAHGHLIMALEYAINVLKIDQFNVEERSDQCIYKVIKYNERQERKIGEHGVEIIKGSLTQEIYPNAMVYERHRNTLQVNKNYSDDFELAGFLITGKSKNQDEIEIMELSNHPFYLGVLFQPQFDSRPTRPHPLFEKFIKTCLENRPVSRVNRIGGENEQKK